MLSLAVLMLGVAAMVAFLDWRRGLALCVLVAMAQDPIRKLVPGEPAYFIVFVGVVFGAAWMGAFLNRVPLNPNCIHGWRRFVGAPFLLLMVIVAVQAVHSYGRWGAPIMTAMGLMFFVAPSLAVVFAYQFAIRRGSRGMIAWLWLYVSVASIAVASVYLEYLGLDWDVLGEVGVGIVIYDVGRALEAYSGFFRASEIAAWHAATAGGLIFLLVLGRHRTFPRWLLALTAIALMVVLGMLTGRRKMLVVMAIFFSTYFFLNQWFRNAAAKSIILAGGFVALSFALLLLGTAEGGAERSNETKRMRVADEDIYTAYILRAQSVFMDVPERVQNLGIAPVYWATQRFGYFGAGLGVATQGAQQFGPRGLKRGGAGEGGLGKITVELGLPGLVVMGWLALAFMRYVWRILRAVSAASAFHARLAYGLAASLIANVAAFSVATQAFGDVFILLFLGTTAGFLFAIPVVAGKELAESAAAAEDAAAKRASALAAAAQAA